MPWVILQKTNEAKLIIILLNFDACNFDSYYTSLKYILWLEHVFDQNDKKVYNSNFTTHLLLWMRYKNLHKTYAEMPSKKLNQTHSYLYGLNNNKMALLGWNFHSYIKMYWQGQILLWKACHNLLYYLKEECNMIPRNNGPCLI